MGQCSCGNVKHVDDPTEMEEKKTEASSNNNNSVNNKNNGSNDESIKSLTDRDRIDSEILAKERMSRARTEWEEEQRKLEEEAKKLDDFKKISQEGVELIKHGRKGKPHSRIFKIDWNKNKIYWKSNKERLKDGFQLKIGKQTDVFKRDIAVEVDEHVCFSIITKNRSIDIQCKDKDQRDVWVNGLKHMMKKMEDADESIMRAKSVDKKVKE